VRGAQARPEVAWIFFSLYVREECALALARANQSEYCVVQVGMVFLVIMNMFIGIITKFFDVVSSRGARSGSSQSSGHRPRGVFVCYS
jgi:hypothetical protein